MRTLIIDDDLVTRDLLTGLLEEYGPVKSAANGEEGVQAFGHGLRTDRFNLVTVDVLMSGMDGYETLRELRKAEGDVPKERRAGLLLITSIKFVRELDSLRKELGPLAVVHKPIDLERLRAGLKELGLA